MTKIMGILNTTPDSFYDGGRYNNLEKAVERGLEIEQEGADYIDVGGESSRPGSSPISAKDEIERVIPIIQKLSKKISIPISIDSYKFEVIEKAFDAGASFINDITGLINEKTRKLAAENDLEVCIMHMKDNPLIMQKNPTYKNVTKDVYNFLKERIATAIKDGISKNKIYLDPGIGFGKTTNQNWELLNSISKFKRLGKVLVGVSRKSFIGKRFGSEQNPLPVEQRLEGSLEIAGLCAKQGVDILRVHDVKETKNFLSHI